MVIHITVERLLIHWNCESIYYSFYRNQYKLDMRWFIKKTMDDNNKIKIEFVKLISFSLKVLKCFDKKCKNYQQDIQTHQSKTNWQHLDDTKETSEKQTAVSTNHIMEKLKLSTEIQQNNGGDLSWSGMINMYYIFILWRYVKTSATARKTMRYNKHIRNLNMIFACWNTISLSGKNNVFGNVVYAVFGELN